jgi:hypothetical protein
MTADFVGTKAFGPRGISFGHRGAFGRKADIVSWAEMTSLRSFLPKAPCRRPSCLPEHSACYAPRTFAEASS